MTTNASTDERLNQLKDIGDLATWSVSSSKPGFGVDNLRDPNMKTLWQSEGAQPHLINIQFHKKQSISQISIYADAALDDSYTPHKISLRAGTYFGDLLEIKSIEMQSPAGWQHFGLGSQSQPNENSDPLRAHLLQIAIISNHMNGKDTHVRGVRVFAPKPLDVDDGMLPFTSVAFKQHETIR
ncbi:hypothetical protein OIO90_002414 [Microbotryomycetes sp. JL221]|nr:hypothetical protein OIO90_002414 [Microbotryomycetes sp. JL221]